MSKKLCYVIITSRSLLWFVCTLVACLLTFSAIVSPNWVISKLEVRITTNDGNSSFYKRSSVGIYSRCKLEQSGSFRCGSFDLQSFATSNDIYPASWKFTMFFISLGFTMLAITVLLTLATCFRQSCIGKSLHTITGAIQMVAGIAILISLFLHPLAWNAKRMIKLCGTEVEPYYLGECSIGWAFYSAVAGTLISFICAGISLCAEKSNMNPRVKRRIEEGEKLVCVP